MKSFRLSPEAAQDLLEIYEYIAHDSLEAAERVRIELLEAVRNLAEMPGKGRRREDLTSRSVLFWPVRSYQVIYSASRPLEVVAARQAEPTANSERKIKAAV